MTELSAIYEQLARPWTHKQLADHYREAKRRGEQAPGCDQDHLIHRPVAMLATAIPVCATLSVATHVIHVLPATGDPGLNDQLFGRTEKSSAVALHRFHQALALDGRVHDYTADQWLPAVYDTAASLLEAARLEREPPSLVEQAQQAVGWLSRAIIELDQDGPDAPAAIVDGVGRILALYMFAAIARHDTTEPGE
jgi:hypothetical protein